jgi:transposase
MNALHEHYRVLLGLDQNWLVAGVELDPASKRVTVKVEYVAGLIPCPGCGRKSPRYDHAAERRWRHLDTMDFETVLAARLPRTNCPDCGVKTVFPCWAGPTTRFTLLLERRAIEILEVCPAVIRAAKLARLDQSTLHDIRKRASQSPPGTTTEARADR